MCLQNQLLPPPHPRNRLRRQSIALWAALPHANVQLQQQDPPLPVNQMFVSKTTEPFIRSRFARRKI